MASPLFSAPGAGAGPASGAAGAAPGSRPGTICLLGAGAKHCGIAAYLFEQVRRYLVANGYRLTESVEAADFLVVDTCAATERSRAPVERLVLDLVARHPDKAIVVHGCLAGDSPELARHPNVVLVPPKADGLAALFPGQRALGAVEMQVPPVTLASVQDPVGQGSADAHLLIAEGCVHRCSYCNVKLVKGGVRSRPVAEIRREAARLVAQGRREIALLADDCGSYGHDLGTDFPTLLDNLLEIDAGVRWQVYYLYPGLFLAQWPRLRQPLEDGRLSYLCVPLQSGSRRILDLMNRRYDPDEVAARLAEVRAANPRIYLFSHFIFDFPSESREELEASLRLIPLFDACLVVEYSANPRTAAGRLLARGTGAGRAAERAAKIERLRQFAAELGAPVESLAGDQVVNWRLQLRSAAL